ncbi:MerR family transcriptional regulator [Streptomyces ortus]|jgi:DNA-binding transcriptional MerR regulator|uniref:MerR family transcriptional regulator n=1 Tax=Streptomyces ortus TaxID=2867268 RepID=A0ABT3VFS8_9ACTN|nr:MerR family transcriptional regulator [Streptomyces ortus]MCX4238480.1 MerR family transcriptional regulator [Streptomyces ortus]
MSATTQQAADLTIQEMARRSGFAESTLRYYEKIGLLGPVARDESSGHRRYGPATADRVEALSCLRSAGMTVSGMRRYLDLLTQGDSAAAEQRDLFAGQAEVLAADIEQLQLRLTYLRRKADLWDARVRGDATAEKQAADEVLDVMKQFRFRL